MTEKKIIQKLPPQKINVIVQTIFACKWSLTVYDLLNKDINRPGQMVRSVDGLSTKVLNDCLRKNIEFGILKKEIFSELPPRVEYSFTPFGLKFTNILTEIEKLNLEM